MVNVWAFESFVLLRYTVWPQATVKPVFGTIFIRAAMFCALLENQIYLRVGITFITSTRSEFERDTSHTKSTRLS